MAKKNGSFEGRRGMNNHSQGRGRGISPRGRGGRSPRTQNYARAERSISEVSPSEPQNSPSINQSSSTKQGFFTPRPKQNFFTPRTTTTPSHVLEGNRFAALSDSPPERPPTTPGRPSSHSNRSPLPSPEKPAAKRQKPHDDATTTQASPLALPTRPDEDEERFNELDRQIQDDLNECEQNDSLVNETKVDSSNDEGAQTDESDMQTEDESADETTQTEDELSDNTMDTDAEGIEEEKTDTALTPAALQAQRYTQWRLTKLDQERAKLQKRVHKQRVTNISAALEAESHSQAEEEGDDNDSDDAGSDATPIQRNAIRMADQALEGLTRRCFGNGIPRRHHLWRYDLKLRVPPSTTPDKALIQVTTAWFTKTKEYDPTAALLPFYDSDDTPSRRAVSIPAKIPQGMGEFKKYLARAAPKVEGGDNYTSIVLATDKSYEEIIADMGWWYKQHGHTLYKRGIQTERTKNLGWILYSTRAMDTLFMRNMLQKLVNEWDVGKKAGLSLPISVRWKMIPRTEKGPTPENEVSRALCIETAFDDADVIKMCMESYYDYKREVFPGGIKLRFVPDKAYLTGFEDIAGYTNLRARQQRFLNNFSEFTTFEIANLHHPFKDKNGIRKSLRARIMEINPKDRPYMSLFLYVDTAFQGDRIVFNFLFQVSSEATTTIAGLVPRMRYLCGDQCRKCFTTYAWDRHIESTWNPETNDVDSPDSQRITGLQEVDPELMFEVTNIEAVSQQSEGPTRPTPANQQKAFPEFEANPDDESCRTFGRPQTNRDTSILPDTDAPSRVSAMSSGTNSSFVTLEDFEKRLAILDKKNHERSIKNESLLQSILDKLAGDSNNFNTPPGDRPEQPFTNTSEGADAVASAGYGESS